MSCFTLSFCPLRFTMNSSFFTWSLNPNSDPNPQPWPHLFWQRNQQRCRLQLQLDVDRIAFARLFETAHGAIQLNVTAQQGQFKLQQTTSCNRESTAYCYGIAIALDLKLRAIPPSLLSLNLTLREDWAPREDLGLTLKSQLVVIYKCAMA